MKRILTVSLIIVALACTGKKINKIQNNRLSSIESRLEKLERRAKDIDTLKERTIEIQYELDAINNEIQYLNEIIEDLQAQIDALNILNGEVDDSIDELQQSITLLEDSLENGLKELIDPCGPESAHDEILIRLNNNKLIAYFEHGSKRYLTVLTPGSYSVTDGTGCNFTIDSNGDIINEHS